MEPLPYCLKRDACAAKTPGRYCGPCNSRRLHSDPEIAERRRAAAAAKFADPDFREWHRVQSTIGAKRDADSPEGRARRAELGRAQYPRTIGRPEILAKSHSPEVAAKRGRRSRATKLAWCPLEYRNLYRSLMTTSRLTRAQARAAIEQQIDVDRRAHQRTGALQQAPRDGD